MPSLLFYTLLNRVRKSGICQLASRCDEPLSVAIVTGRVVCSLSPSHTLRCRSVPSIGTASLNSLQLRQLLELASSVVCDGCGATGPGHQLEQLVDSMHSSSSSQLPAQKLILLNAALDLPRVVKLSQLLSTSSSCLLSLVLGNIPLHAAAVLALAGALGHSRLEQLVLEDCAVGNAGAAALFEALGHNRSLWKLDLSRNHVSDSACSALGQALLTNRRLEVRTRARAPARLQSGLVATHTTVCDAARC